MEKSSTAYTGVSAWTGRYEVARWRRDCRRAGLASSPNPGDRVAGLMRQLWIGGKGTPSRGGSPRVIEDPATLEAVDEVYEGTAADVEAATQSASQAQTHWRRVPAVERAR